MLGVNWKGSQIPFGNISENAGWFSGESWINLLRIANGIWIDVGKIKRVSSM